MNASDYYKYAQLATAAYVDLSLELNLADGQRLAAGFTGIGLQSAQQVIGASGFGADAQTLRPFNGLQEGFVKLA